MPPAHSPNGALSVGPELPEVSLGIIFCPERKKTFCDARHRVPGTWWSKLLKHGPAVLLKTHVAAPGSTNSERLTTRMARERFVNICACTERIGTGIGAVCVERGRPKWPTTMLNSTARHTYRLKKSYPTRSHDPLRRGVFSL